MPTGAPNSGHRKSALVPAAGTSYENTYVWIMRLSGGMVVDGTAFYDSIAFNELWETVTP
jgi:ketosteroid isomerase-like protein